MSPVPTEPKTRSSLRYQRAFINDVASSRSDEHSDEVRWLFGSSPLRGAEDCSSGLTRVGTVEAAYTLPTRGCGGDEQTLQQTYFRGSASCVQSFDDSLDIACRMTYRISLRSSSLWEPRHPLLKVLISLIFFRTAVFTRRHCFLFSSSDLIS